MHTRRAIREAIASALTGLSTTGSRVYQTRIYPVADNNLPGLAIYTRSESDEYTTITQPRKILRTLTASIEAYVKATADIDDQLDAIASEVEVAIYADVTLGGNAKDARIVSFEADFSGDPDQPVGTGIIQLEVDYVTIEGAPEVAV